MKPLFRGLVLIFILYFIEIEAAENIQKIKKKANTAGAAVPDDERHKNIDRKKQILGTPAGQKNPPNSNSWDRMDSTGVNAYKLFLRHYEKKSIPDASDITLKLYHQHASGSNHSRGKKSDYMTERLKETRKIYFKTITKQRMDQQHKASHDPSGASKSSSRSSHHRYQNQYNVHDQSGGDASGSDYINPHLTPAMTPSEDLYSHFEVQPPEHLDFEQISSRSYHSATALIDNYNIHLRRKYGDNPSGSGSV